MCHPLTFYVALILLTSHYIATTRAFLTKPRYPLSTGNLQLSAQNNPSDETNSWEDESSFHNDDVPLPTISAPVLSVVDKSLGLILTSAAIKTVGYYMIEFHDEMTNNWMVQYLNYSRDGFPNDNWQTYIESMIHLEPHEIDVTIQPTKRNIKPGSATIKGESALHYLHEIEPRKVAHRIISVREDVSNEVANDLATIKLENKESIKYAKLWLSAGKDYADTHRGLTRMGDRGGSTPFRERNYFDVSLLVRVKRNDLFCFH